VPEPAISATHAAYPDISDLFPAASRMQRATFDMLGLHAIGADDHRKWLRHAAWPAASTRCARALKLSQIIQ